MPIQGLLQKANLLQSEGLAFFDFITKHKIKYCAFFKRFSLHYAITLAHTVHHATCNQQ